MSLVGGVADSGGPNFDDDYTCVSKLDVEVTCWSVVISWM